MSTLLNPPAFTHSGTCISNPATHPAVTQLHIEGAVRTFGLTVQTQMLRL
jgi:hypothetical protein